MEQDGPHIKKAPWKGAMESKERALADPGLNRIKQCQGRLWICCLYIQIRFDLAPDFNLVSSSYNQLIASPIAYEKIEAGFE
jgi:hypothetical protein